MLLKYFYDKALAHASYLVGCQKTGEAIVVDPGGRTAGLVTVEDLVAELLGEIADDRATLRPPTTEHERSPSRG